MPLSSASHCGCSDCARRMRWTGRAPDHGAAQRPGGMPYRCREAARYSPRRDRSAGTISTPPGKPRMVEASSAPMAGPTAPTPPGAGQGVARPRNASGAYARPAWGRRDLHADPGPCRSARTDQEDGRGGSLTAIATTVDAGTIQHGRCVCALLEVERGRREIAAAPAAAGRPARCVQDAAVAGAWPPGQTPPKQSCGRRKGQRTSSASDRWCTGPGRPARRTQLVVVPGSASGSGSQQQSEHRAQLVQSLVHRPRAQPVSHLLLSGGSGRTTWRPWAGSRSPCSRPARQ